MNLPYFVFLVLLSNFWSNIAEELRAEKIVGGHKARDTEFKHVIAVMYKSTGPYDENPCAGAVVSDKFIATVAHCFYIKRSGKLRNAEYYVTISVKDLREIPYLISPPARHIRISIVIIPKSYSPFGLDDHTTEGDLALVKLTESVGWRPRHPDLTILTVRYFDHNLWRGQYHVAGYGYHEVSLLLLNANGTYLQDGFSDGKLRSAKVLIMTDQQCMDKLQATLAPGIFCGKAQRFKRNIPVGICKFDSGAPLSHHKYLDGIAVNGYSACDEEQKPGIYINVTYYYEFISNAMADEYTDDMYVVQQVVKQDQFVFEKLKLDNTSYTDIKT